VLSVAWYIYEFAALGIPMRHVHPDGECSQMFETDSQAQDEEDEKPIDPRWSELKKILDNNKK